MILPAMIVRQCEISSELPIQTVSLPTYSVPLYLDFQYGVLYLWCLVDTNTQMQDRTVYIYRTDQPINPSNVSYLGTVKEEDTGYVLHVFWRVGK